VVLARFQSIRIRSWLEELLEGRFKLTINREKTRVVLMRQPGASFDFLGYTFRYDKDLQGRAGRYLNVQPSAKALARARTRLRELTRPQRCFMPIPEIIAEVNQWLTGWQAYFSYGYPRSAYRSVHRFMVSRLSCHLNRRSQRAYRPPRHKSFYAHLHDLGLKRP
jgi:RNA-directed DNA polymerase